MTSYLLLGCVVLLTHFLEGITGFGCTVLALPFAILLIGTKQAVPVLLFLALLLAVYIVWIDRQRIVWREFAKIVAFVGLGLPFGIFTFGYFDENVLRWILGAFMVIVAVRGLLSYVVSLNESRLPKWVLNLLLVAGGFIHGVFSSGGPLVEPEYGDAGSGRGLRSDDAGNLENHRHLPAISGDRGAGR